MLALSSNWKDVQKYYQSTYIKVRELGEDPVLVEKVDPQAMWLVIRGGEKIELTLDEEVGYHLDYCIPKKTVYQEGRSAMILERIPARMWKKGLSSENTMLSEISSTGVFGKRAINWDTLFNFINKPEYGTLGDLHFNMSVALSSRIYATHSGTICIDSKVVGEVKDNKVYVLKLFAENIKPLVSGYETVEV